MLMVTTATAITGPPIPSWDFSSVKANAYNMATVGLNNKNASIHREARENLGTPAAIFMASEIGQNSTIIGRTSARIIISIHWIKTTKTIMPENIIDIAPVVATNAAGSFSKASVGLRSFHFAISRIHLAILSLAVIIHAINAEPPVETIITRARFCIIRRRSSPRAFHIALPPAMRIPTTAQIHTIGPVATFIQSIVSFSRLITGPASIHDVINV